MLGKTLEVLNLSMLELEKFSIGANYNSGIYNISVQQGNNFQTMRVVKD